MITTRAVPVPLTHHHRRVAQIPAVIKNDFADPLGTTRLWMIFEHPGIQAT